MYIYTFNLKASKSDVFLSPNWPYDGYFIGPSTILYFDMCRAGVEQKEVN